MPWLLSEMFKIYQSFIHQTYIYIYFIQPEYRIVINQNLIEVIGNSNDLFVVHELWLNFQ